MDHDPFLKDVFYAEVAYAFHPAQSIPGGLIVSDRLL